MVTNFVSRSVEEATDYNYKVKIENLRISLPLGIKTQKIIFSDKKAEFLIIENFGINITPSLLLLGEVNVKDITAEHFILTRLPNSHLISKKQDLTNKKQLGFVPNIKVTNITISNFILSSELTELSEDIGFSFAANLNFYSQNQTIHFWTKLKTNPEANGLADEKLSLITDAVLDTEGQFDFANNNLIMEDVKFETIVSTLKQ